MIDLDRSPIRIKRLRMRVAKALVRVFDVDGVLFDGVVQTLKQIYGIYGRYKRGSRLAHGWCYADRKQRFEDGWYVWSSLVKKIEKLNDPKKTSRWVGITMPRREWFPIPEGALLVTTNNSRYIIIPKQDIEKKPDGPAKAR